MAPVTPFTQNMQMPTEGVSASTPSRGGKKILVGVLIFALLFGVGVWLYFGPLAFLKYMDTYKEGRQLESVLYAYGEPGNVYYFVHWYSRAQVGVRPLCCTLDDTLVSEQRLYKYSFSTNTSEFVSLFNPDRPEDGQPSRNDGATGVISAVRDGGVIYGKIVGSAQKYYEITLSNNVRDPIFTDLPVGMTLERVKKLNGDNYFACGYINGSRRFPKGMFLNRSGTITKEIADACQLSSIIERNSYILVTKTRDITDLTQPNIHYKIDNNGKISEVVPTGREQSVAAPDGNYWAAIVQGDQYTHSSPSLTIYHGDMINVPEQHTVVLSKEYLDAIPGQPNFPNKKEAYIKYAKKKLFGKD